jgi:hypothetical protein
MKNKALIIIALILASMAFYYLFTNKNSTIKDKDFAVEDTASIYKIFLADLANNKVLLQRLENGSWEVNGKYEARNDAIQTLLETLKRMAVKAPVAKAAHDNVIRSIASGHIKVELYSKSEEVPFKVIYVGGETPDHLGTYMLLEDATAPYILEIPGFNGYLSSRFIISEEGWRNRNIFRFSDPLSQINSISLENFNKAEESFKIELSGGKITSVSALKNNINIDFDSSKTSGYVSRFSQIGFESIVKGMNKQKTDSILKAVPMYILKLKTINGADKELIMHPMAASEDELDMNGMPLKYDPDRFYIQIVTKEGRDFVVAQYYSFERLLKPLNFFKK